MKVFFDNCTPPVFATTLHGFVQHDGHAAFHIKDVPTLPKGRNTADIEWIDFLRSAPDEWVFVTGDGRVLKNRAERFALRSAGLIGFVLASAYQRTPLNQTAATLVWRWPELVRIVDLVSAPAMYEIPIGRNTKLKQLSV